MKKVIYALQKCASNTTFSSTLQSRSLKLSYCKELAWPCGLRAGLLIQIKTYFLPYGFESCPRHNLYFLIVFITLFFLRASYFRLKLVFSFYCSEFDP